MRKIIVTLCIVASVSFVSCQASDKKPVSGTSSSDPSYAFGVAIGTSIKTTSVTINYDSFVKGMKDVIEKNAPTLTMEEAGKIIQASIAEATKKKGEENIAKETEFLAANAKKTGIKTTESGLQYEVIKEGTGAMPKSTDMVKVDYVGTLLDGTTFDSSIERKQPAEFPLNGVIPGWTEGLQLMKVGGKTKFYIPSKLAYGPNPQPGSPIGPNATLVFEVDLLEILPPATSN